MMMVLTMAMMTSMVNSLGVMTPRSGLRGKSGNSQIIPPLMEIICPVI